MKRTACLLLSAVFFLSAFAQTDSVEHSLPVKTLGEVIIKAYEQNRKLAEVAAPIGYIGQQDLNRYGNTSIVPALNAVPGVRMEERSPGSYRLNVRGSTLRSPFGVRDVKVYWNDIPLTDPGGNTYLNGQGYYNFQSLEIIKGPAGSLYGAGIGGAILIHSLPSTWAPGINVEYSNGSFQTNSLHAAIRLGDENRKTNFDYSHQTSSGYRSQTNMRRDVASWETEVKATGKQSLHAFILYSDLFYQTPGALTLAQYNADPRQARPGSGSAPGAVQNKAAIYQKTFIAGLSSTYQFSAHWQNTTAFYGAYTDFLNPGIRVYEIRKEPHAGGRTVFRYTDQWNGVTLQFNAGAEAQKGFFNTKDYANKLGVTDTLQSDDNINNWQYMVFAQADLLLPHGWAITLGGSYNKSAVQFTRLSVVPPALQSRTFENKLPPRLAILKKLTPGLSAYASVARGFSTPAVSELLRSDGVLGTNLQPEDGLDYELGLKGNLLQGRLYADLSVFFFDLKHTIVQRIDTNGVFFDVNAGSTRQNGLEGYVSYLLIDRPLQLVSNAKVWVSYAFDDFHYHSFKQDSSDFSGNKLPGVAPQVVTAGFDLQFNMGLYANLTYAYSDAIQLNDANSAHAGSFNLFGARLGFKKTINKKFSLQLFAGADNVGNVRYSLGNDINAAAGRYYNAAPGRNYFAGLSIGFLSCRQKAG